MNYIEIKINKDNKLICKYVNIDENKKIIIENKKIVDILTLIKNSNLEPKIKYINGEEVLRYYNIDENIISNTINIKEKKKKNNKYTAQMISITGGILSLVLVFNAFSKNNTKSESIPKIPDNYIELVNNSFVNEVFKNGYFDRSTIVKGILGEDYEIPEEVKVDRNFEFIYEDRSQISDAIFVRENFHDIIEKYSNMYGLPTNLMIAIATEESRGNCTAMSSSSFGIFQIKIKGGWNWVGKQITAFNFEKNDYETVTVCLNSSGQLEPEMLADPDYCSKIACMIFSNNLERCNYDIICAIQAYNSGNKPINLQKKYGEDWVYYRDEQLNGSNYIEEVLSFIDSNDNVLIYKDSDFNCYSVSVKNIRQKSRKRVLTII